MAKRERLTGGRKLPCRACGRWVTVASMVQGRCLACYVDRGRCPCCQSELYEAEDARREAACG